MAKFYVNFVITVVVDRPEITAADLDSSCRVGDDVTDDLSDEQWDDIVNEALDIMEIGAENIESIEYRGE